MRKVQLVQVANRMFLLIKYLSIQKRALAQSFSVRVLPWPTPYPLFRFIWVWRGKAKLREVVMETKNRPNILQTARIN